MTWSPKQRLLFLKAANAARWNGPMRYIAMRHAGCPVDPALKRPSVKHRANTNEMFARVMELAESQAIERVPPPREHDSWAAAARATLGNRRDFARQIAMEGCRRLPVQFCRPTEEGADDLFTDDAADRLLRWAVGNVTENDTPDFAPIKPVKLDECDTGQLYRVVECLKAVVGRKLLAAGLRPESFDAPAEARRRAQPAHRRAS